jgi:hypothetical protein
MADRGSGGTCPITLTAEPPGEPDPATAELVLRVFGPPGTFREQAWLLYLAEGAQEPPGPSPAPVVWPFLLVGPLDEVTVTIGGPCKAVVRLVADERWRTMGNLYRQVEVPGQATALRYVSLLADRFDGRGRRMERIAAARCTVGPFDVLAGEGGTAVELTPRDGLWWWGERAGRTG